MAIDIKENEILSLRENLLDALLVDQSKSKIIGIKSNIIWATDIYSIYGDGFYPEDTIEVNKITGINGNVIQPRINKNKEQQVIRSRDKGEVFTPAWLCNKQNNISDNSWMGDKYMFNKECDKLWETRKEKVPFPTSTGRTWQEYVLSPRIEITCGEAPYLVSRYDTISGKEIDIKNRIGILDRKIRVVTENVSNREDWLKWVIKAYKNTYGFDFQGDNVLLARENLLYTFFEYYKYQYVETLETSIIDIISDIISWNIWQMDANSCVIPYSCHNEKRKIIDMFEEREELYPCEGCKKNDKLCHNGIYCLFKDWSTDQLFRFVDIVK